MKKKIAILGSTGSIGKYTLDIIRKDKKNFQIILLTANRNYKKLIKQAKEFNVKNILIYNDKYYEFVKQKLKNKKINIFNNFLLCLEISLVCQLGDIFISYIKRKAKVKNTGNFLPGHGGLLDRIDGIIFVIPFVWIHMNGLSAYFEIMKGALSKL